MSGLGIDDQGIPNHFVSEMPAEVHRRSKIDSASPEQMAHLFCYFGEPEETNACPRSEFNQDVDVTRDRKPWSQY